MEYLTSLAISLRMGYQMSLLTHEDHPNPIDNKWVKILYVYISYS